MLTLARKHNEKIIISTPDNREIVIRINHIGNSSQVKLSIGAPEDYLILRDELAKSL